MRNSLVPYIYTEAFLTFETGVTMLHPLYYDYPDEENAYLFSTYRGPGKAIQYAFGGDFFVAPVTMPVDQVTGKATFDELWIPPGQWQLVDRNQTFTGPAIVKNMSFPVDLIPVFAKIGSIIPLKTMDSVHDIAPETLVLSIFYKQGLNGSTIVYEDDGETLDYIHKKAYSITNITMHT